MVEAGASVASPLSRLAASAASAVLLMAGCGGSSQTTVPLDDVLAGAAANFDALQSVRFDIRVDGAPVFLDAKETLAAREATGQYDAPESFQAVVQVTAFDLAVELGAISIGERRWVTNPVTGRWGQLAEGIGFDPLQLFDPDTGIGATLMGMDDAELVSAGSRYHVRGTVRADRVGTLTAGLLDDESVQLDVLIDTELRLNEVSFDVGAPASEWTISFSEFDDPVTINPPVE